MSPPTVRALTGLGVVLASLAATLAPTAAEAGWLKCTCTAADRVCSVKGLDNSWSRTRDRGDAYDHLQRKVYKQSGGGDLVVYEGGRYDEKVRLPDAAEWSCAAGSPPPPKPPPPPSTPA